MKYLMIVFVALTMFLAGCEDAPYSNFTQLYVGEKLDEYNVVTQKHRYILCNNIGTKVEINKSDFDTLVHVGDYVTVKDKRVIVVTQQK